MARKKTENQRIELIYIPVAQLKKLPGNPRRDTDSDAVQKLAKLIRAHGFQNPLQVYPEKDGCFTILAGNHRLDAGVALGMGEFPCIVYEGSPKQALARAISDNKSSDWTDWDFPALKDMVVEIDDGSIDLEITGFTGEELVKTFSVLGAGPPKKEGTAITCPQCGHEFKMLQGAQGKAQGKAADRGDNPKGKLDS